MCEISELTVDVVHAMPVKQRDDDGGGDEDDHCGGGDDVGGDVAGDSDSVVNHLIHLFQFRDAKAADRDW